MDTNSSSQMRFCVDWYCPLPLPPQTNQERYDKEKQTQFVAKRLKGCNICPHATHVYGQRCGIPVSTSAHALSRVWIRPFWANVGSTCPSQQGDWVPWVVKNGIKGVVYMRASAWTHAYITKSQWTQHFKLN